MTPSLSDLADIVADLARAETFGLPHLEVLAARDESVRDYLDRVIRPNAERAGQAALLLRRLVPHEAAILDMLSREVRP